MHDIKMFHSGVERSVDTPWMIQPVEKTQQLIGSELRSFKSRACLAG